MSFRLRVLALVALVAVTATTVTAWLTLQQASQQVTESADARQADVETIRRELTEYGIRHGTWEGVATLADELRFRTGQRIKLVTEFGQVVVDTDTLAGRTARPVDAPPISISPRPSLELPTGAVALASLVRITLDEIDTYRSGVLLAACLTRRRADVLVTPGPYGVPRHSAEPGTVADCAGFATVPDSRRDQDAATLEPCTGGVVRTGQPAPLPPVPTVDPAQAVHRQQLAACLAQVFDRRIAEFAPVPLLTYLGAVDDDPAEPLSVGPVLAAAALVAALAIAGSLLLSRRVLRPIRALTSASHRLGDGDLTGRVPVAGRDELAGLAQSFNRMATSLQRGEERQRRLVADVAHELRTPLANVRGYLEALKDGVVAPEPELFASLHEEAVLQQRIVDDLQDLALAEAGSLVYHRSRVDLAELLETCRTAHAAAAESAGVELSATAARPTPSSSQPAAASGGPATASGGPVAVEADPDRLRQVLGNLVGNALRATPAGGSITLTGTREGDWVVVTVADTGTGIAPEHQPFVFDRFWRADAARGRRTGGSGLGLAIARQIVTDHGGTITVTSAPGAGTRFTIRLPAG